jgi:hypothetical protein
MREFEQVYEVRPRNHKRGADLIGDQFPFRRLWYGEPNAVNNTIGYALHYKPISRCCDSRLLDVIETHQHAGDFKEW